MKNAKVRSRSQVLAKREEFAKLKAREGSVKVNED